MRKRSGAVFVIRNAHMVHVQTPERSSMIEMRIVITHTRTNTHTHTELKGESEKAIIVGENV